ncbi:MAG: insulinase family protein [Proteobacteria bacterium]|nr:insulinase family protein [Pseudomonadota bacterium]
MAFPVKAARAALVAALLVAGWAGPAAAVAVQRVVSDAGIEAWLVQDDSIPVISLSASFRGGAALDPPGLEGLANMTARLLDEGAGVLPSQEFQAVLEDNAITLGFEASLDQFNLHLRTLRENRGLAFRLLELALTEPRFDREPIERVRRQLLAEMERSRQQPQRVANRAWFNMVFPDHPYGRPVSGTPATISEIGRDELGRFVSERFARDSLVVGVAGDVSPAELKGLLDMAFARLPAGAAPVRLADAVPAAGGQTLVINVQVPQSVVVFGQRGVKRTDPDYYAALVMNYILGGGGFSSRLTEEVREKRGLAYGVYSYLSPMDRVGLLMGGVATENARVAETLKVVTGEWRRMREEGPTASELADAKTFLTGSFPLRFTSTGRIAETLVGMQIYDLGLDYIDRYAGLIEAVTLEDVRRVARDLLDPDELAVVVVGQPEGISSTP